MASPKYFYLCNEKGDLKQSFKHFLYKYLSKSDTCQLESKKKKTHARFKNINNNSNNNHNGAGLVNKLK